MGEMGNKYDSLGIHKKIKDIIGTDKKKSYILIKDKQVVLMMDAGPIIKDENY